MKESKSAVSARRLVKSFAVLLAFWLAGHTHAGAVALVAKLGPGHDWIIIGDDACFYMETMIFRVAPMLGRVDRGLVPQPGAQPFHDVCSILSGKPGSRPGFQCGPLAPFGLANTRWIPKANIGGFNQSEEYRQTKFVCSRGCNARNSKLEFILVPNECS